MEAVDPDAASFRPIRKTSGVGWDCRLMAERRWRTEGKTLLMNSPPHPRERLWLDSNTKLRKWGEVVEASPSPRSPG